MSDTQDQQTDTDDTLTGQAGAENGRNTVIEWIDSAGEKAVWEQCVFSVDECWYATSGFLIVWGWLNDDQVDFVGLEVSVDGRKILTSFDSCARFRRRDVESAIYGEEYPHEYGYFAILKFGQKLPPVDRVEFRLMGSTGTHVTAVQPQITSDQRLLQKTLSFLATRELISSPNCAAMIDVGGEFGSRAKTLWRTVLNQNSPYSDLVIGGPPVNPRLSIITVLYGRADLLPIQAALLYRDLAPDIELIYANNSPEIRDQLLREAETAYEIYGIPFRIIDFKGNTGFGFANNQCVSLARSDRLLLLNPDVVSAGDGWIEDVHRSAVESPNTLNGAVLLYSDGVVMHDGMDVVADRLPLVPGPGSPSHILRVDHFSKGAPLWAIGSEKYRRVPAVTGAFMSIPRALFESVGGFSTDYVFGHYEDADLCLRVWEQGGEVVVDRDLRLYHCEGLGSSWGDYHDGSSLLNRCVFSHRWLDNFEEIRNRATDLSSES